MIKIPVNVIIDKIVEKAGLSKEEVDTKIKTKLDELSGLISEEGAAHIIANELGVKLVDPESNKDLKIKDIYAGMRNVAVNGKITAKYEIREFNSNGRQGKVGSFMIGDDTGRTRITCWGSKADEIADLEEGDIVKVENGFAKENNSRVEVHLNDNSIITKDPAGVEIGDVKQGFQNKRRSINDINPGDENIEILGTIVQAYDPNFWEVCPQCNKKVRNEDGETVCNEHGKVESDFSYVMNCYIDDGTDSIRGVFFKNQIQNLIDKEHTAILDMRQTGFEDMKNDLLGKIISVTGRVTQNEMFARKEFIVQFVNNAPDPKKELERLDLEETKEDVKEESPTVEKSSDTDDSDEIAKEIEEAKQDESKSIEEDDASEELLSLDELETIDDDEDIYS